MYFVVFFLYFCKDIMHTSCYHAVSALKIFILQPVWKQGRKLWERSTCWYLSLSHWSWRERARERDKMSINTNSEAACESGFLVHLGKAWSCLFWWLCSGSALPSTTPTSGTAGRQSSTCLSGAGRTSLQSVSVSWVPMALVEFRYVQYGWT